MSCRWELARSCSASVLVLLRPMPNLITSVPGGLQRSRQEALKLEGLNNRFGSTQLRPIWLLGKVFTGNGHGLLFTVGDSRWLESTYTSGPPTEQPTPPHLCLETISHSY